MKATAKKFETVDDILASVVHEDDANYIQVAIRCYNASACRACIVMTVDFH